MNKRKPKDQATQRIVQKEAIAEIRGEEDFVEFLRRELEWPIPYNIQKLSDVAIPHDLQRDFGFDPAEDRIGVSRLLNLADDQPWGVFLFEFKTKKPQLSHLRKILRVLGSQKTLLKGDPIWDREDLLFICTSDWSQFQFVHFSGKKAESAVISSFGWKGPDDPFLHTLCKHNLPRLRMPTPGTEGSFIADSWRDTWKEAFNVKPVTDEFYATLKEVFDAVQAGITGLDGEQRRFFAELVVNRLIFLKFVEKKGWLDDDRDYLYSKFRAYGKSDFWGNFLCFLFFEGLCQEPANRSQKANAILGEVPFLNAELFSPSENWNDWEIKVNNRAFDLLFDKLLNPYNFTVCETSPLDIEVAFNQDLLGYGYEELIADQHGQGAYYTHPTEVNLMCRQSLWAYLENRCPEVSKDSIGRLLYSELDEEHSISREHALILYKALHEVTVVDPALGSGTFPVAMMKHLFLVQTTLGEILSGYSEYESLISQGSITDHRDAFALKLHIIERSIYGCDIDYFAVQIAKLRFWIELMVDCEHPEALPNFDCKLVVGDALVSVVGTDSNGKLITLEELMGHPTRSSNQGEILHSIGRMAIEELGQLKHDYFNAKSVENRHTFDRKIKEKQLELLLSLGIERDKIKVTDKHVLWQIAFAEIFSGDNPGFDIAIANPPYLRQELINDSFVDFGLKTDKNNIISIYYGIMDVQMSGKSDLYVFFYLRSLQLIRPDNGSICFICSNSWLDVDFGQAIKRAINIYADQAVILDNRHKRSFDLASINTIITIIHTGKPGFNGSKAIFMMFDTAFEKCLNHDDFMVYANEFSEKSYGGKKGKSRINIVPLSDLEEKNVYSGSWSGQFLRAPDFYIELLSEYRHKFIRLSEVVDLQFGIKTGANEFFHLSKDTINKWSIEHKYTIPLIRSPRECKRFSVNESDTEYSLLVCDKSRYELANSNIIKYIEWGEQNGYHKRPSCASRNPWYYVGNQVSPEFIMLRFRDQRNWTPIIESKEIAAGDTVFVGSFKNKSDYNVGCAVLNSTLTTLMTEIFGRVNLGDGLLTTYGPELHELLIVDPKLLIEFQADIKNVFSRMLKREVKSIFAEIAQPDRIELDRLILKAIGMPETQLQRLYESVVSMTSERINKANSLKNQEA